MKMNTIIQTENSFRLLAVTFMGLALCLCAQFCPAQSTAPADIKTLKAKYEQGLAVIQSETDKALTNSVQGYADALKGLGQKLQGAGDLDGMLAVKKEAERFEKEKTMPESAVVADCAALRDLQLKWQKMPDTIDVSKSRKIVTLSRNQIAVLEEVKKQFTMQGKVDAAVEAKNEIERVRTSAEVTAAEFVLASAGIDLAAKTNAVAKAVAPTRVDPLASLRSSLVLYYSFDREEKSLGRNDQVKVTDKSGRKNDGEVTGAKWTARGKVGGAYSFDGSGSTLIDAGNPGDLDKNFSIVVWVYPEVYNGYRCIISKDTDNDGFSLEKAAESSSMKFWFFDGTWHNTAFRHVPPLKKWSCLAVVHDGKTVRGYFNGDQDTGAISAGDIVQRNSRILIGRHPAAEAARNWKGLIDEVMIFNRALSETEVKQIYDAQK
jgi:Concanavalin A-like lectin/glucanases superfamily